MIRPRNIALLYALFASLAVLLLAITMPPMQNADEGAHVFRADQISHLGLLGVKLTSGQIGGFVDSGLKKLNTETASMHFQPSVKAPRAWYVPLPWGAPAPAGFPNTAIYPPPFYLPAAVMAASTRAAGIGLPHALVLMRIATGIASVAITACAIAIAGSAAIWLFTLATLPMSFALDAAISQDGPMLACTALSVALSIRLQKPGLPHPRLEFVAMCALLALVGMARPPYAAFALLPLAAPLPKAWRLAGAAAICACVLAWSAVAAPQMVLPVWPAGPVAPFKQLALLALHPWRVPLLAIRTWQADGGALSANFVAGLGWLDVDFPPFYISLAWGMLAWATLAAWCAGRGRFSIHGAALGLTAILAATGGVGLIQYLTWTAVGAPVIDGLQGRYFLAPAMLLAVPLARPITAPASITRWLAAPLLALPVLSIAITIHALILRYYLPQ